MTPLLADQQSDPQPAEMADLTRQALADGTEALFQATFIADDLLVKADQLRAYCHLDTLAMVEIHRVFQSL